MELLAAFLLILGTGFFAGSETALYRSNWIRLTTWLKARIPGADQALRCLDHRDATLVASIVGTNLCAVFATELASRFFVETFGPAFTWAAVALVVLLTIFLGEYMPKAVAQALPDNWLRFFGILLNFSRVLFAPAVQGLTMLGRLFSRPLPQVHPRPTLTRHDFLAALRRRAGTTVAARPIAGLVSRLFQFSTTKVGELAIPIDRVCSLPSNVGLMDILAAIQRYGYSRLPVYEGTPENITGVILAKDLITAPSFRVRRVRRFYETTRAMEVLRELQHHGEHLALVLNAAGQVTGIITLEDLLEELVGEIRSEA